ncbi:MAG: guanylate kinase [Candidatus Cloacimonetes bacterium]|nr:guanylate kinase [Candidatus Cloacimonadota bacterium]
MKTPDYPKKNFLIVVSAPSGGGKSTICRAILDIMPNVDYSISYTTRQPRINEITGKDYFFVSEKRFEELIGENDFLEYALVHKNWYGTSRSFILDKFAINKHVIMDIDPQGARSIVASGIDVVTIFLLPPDIETLEERLRKRDTDTEETIKLRLENARNELDSIEEYDYLVINDDLEVAIEDVRKIIEAEENRVTRYYSPEKIFYGGNLNDKETDN